MSLCLPILKMNFCFPMLHVSSVFCLLFSRFQIVSGLSGYSSDPQFPLIKLLLLKNSFLWGRYLCAGCTISSNDSWSKQTRDGYQKCSSLPPGTRLKYGPWNSWVLRKAKKRLEADDARWWDINSFPILNCVREVVFYLAAFLSGWVSSPCFKISIYLISGCSQF